MWVYARGGDLETLDLEHKSFNQRFPYPSVGFVACGLEFEMGPLYSRYDAGVYHTETVGSHHYPKPLGFGQRSGNLTLGFRATMQDFACRHCVV